MSSVEDRARAVQAVVFDVDGVLTDGSLHFGAEGEQIKVFHARDGMGMAMLRDVGYRLALITGRRGAVVEARARELGVQHLEQGCHDKGTALEALAAKWELSLDAFAGIGDDLIDWPMLRRAGLSAAPSDAHPFLLERVHLPLQAPGGKGAVRELSELLLRASGRWSEYARRFELESEPEGEAS